MIMEKAGGKVKQIMNMQTSGKSFVSTNYIIGNEVFTVIDAAGHKMGTKISMEDYKKKLGVEGNSIDMTQFDKFLDENAKKVGEETILGKNCEIYDIKGNSKISVYDKKYVMRIASQAFNAVATNLDTNPDFPADNFDVPKDVDFKSMDMLKNIDPTKMKDMMKNLKK
jgi:hypothetical protein